MRDNTEIKRLTQQLPISRQPFLETYMDKTYFSVGQWILYEKPRLQKSSKKLLNDIKTEEIAALQAVCILKSCRTCSERDCTAECTFILLSVLYRLLRWVDIVVHFQRPHCVI